MATLYCIHFLRDHSLHRLHRMRTKHILYTFLQAITTDLEDNPDI